MSTAFPLSAAPNILDERPRHIDSLPVAIYACDARGLIRWANAHAARLWGREPKAGVDRCDTATAEALRAGSALEGARTVVQRPDGTSLSAVADTQTITDGAGRVLGAVVCLHHSPAPDLGVLDRELLDALPIAVYTTDAGGRITFFNPAAAEMWGREPALGSDLWCGSWKLYSADGKPMRHDECPMAIALRENRPVRGVEAIGERPDGSRFWFVPYPTPLRNDAGDLVGAVNMLIDITKRKLGQERIETLSREVNHRAKNMLAVIQSIIRLSTTDPHRDFAETLLGRVTALGRAHSLLSENRWEGADLRRLIEEELAPFREGADSRATVDGPHLALASSAAQPLSMALHELATNAAKYGALSVAAGCVDVRWTREADGRVCITWTEHGGPPVAPPQKRNFGLNVISIVVGSQLGGTVTFDWRPEGLVCRAEMPAATLAH